MSSKEIPWCVLVSAEHLGLGPEHMRDLKRLPLYALGGPHSFICQKYIA